MTSLSPRHHEDNRDRLLAMLDEKDQRIRSLYRELERAQQTISEMRAGIESVADAIEEDSEEWELAETLRGIAKG